MVVRREPKWVPAQSRYDPDFCHELIEHMAKGYSFDSFAGTAQVTVTTLKRWREKYVDFADAAEIGWAKRLQYWETVGLRLAATGKGNASAWTRVMESQFGWGRQLQLPGPDGQIEDELRRLTDDELNARIAELDAQDAEWRRQHADGRPVAAGLSAGTGTTPPGDEPAEAIDCESVREPEGVCP